MTTTTTKISKNCTRTVIREVWRHNLLHEFDLIRRLLPQYPYISMDTEFPGVIFRTKKFKSLSPADQYRLLKSNVDALNLIQLGITLCDAGGNLPYAVLGGVKTFFVWQFNFRDFDITRDPCAPDSIDLLIRQGINFEANRLCGINSAHFRNLMRWSGLIFNPSVTWITYHGGSDFAYLVKVLTRCQLPHNLEGFISTVKLMFGDNVFDVKHLLRFCPHLNGGGLDRVSAMLGLSRGAGKCHQAGSDSLLTCHLFIKVRDVFFSGDEPEQYAGVLYGLEVW